MQMCYCYQKLEISTSGADRKWIPSILSLSLAYTDHMGADPLSGVDRERIGSISGADSLGHVMSLSQSEAQNKERIGSGLGVDWEWIGSRSVGICSRSTPKRESAPICHVISLSQSEAQNRATWLRERIPSQEQIGSGFLPIRSRSHVISKLIDR